MARSDSSENPIETESNGEEENKDDLGQSGGDLDAEIAAMMIKPSVATTFPAQHLQHRISRSVNYPRISSDMGISNNPTLRNPHSLDAHSALIRSESIPALSSSSHAQSPHISSHDQHGFELSYWQKFALNELFMRLLPFLQTLTIGRSDKPSKRARIEDLSSTSGELSAGVCFFLARCFNVMHDMPDTALQSVLWMDVTVKDVALLVKMIELRDIMVDERYWKRGYWATDRLSVRDLRVNEEVGDENQLAEHDDDEDDWDGFYYLLNQEGVEKKAQPPTKKTTLRSVSSASGKRPQRKASTIKGGASPSPSSAPSSFSRQPPIDPLPSQEPINNTSSESSSVSAQSSNISSSSTMADIVSAPSSSSSIRDQYQPKNKHSHVSAPAAWQGFGDGVSETDSGVSEFFGERRLHPAVLMYEALKIEISEAAYVSRTLNKGKNLATSTD
ncbi:hypothetical protein BGZ58_003854 [Dissophora ornata]|nr:hypothetical protein BGZ58_003854 [Dissophora ornata]